VITFFVVAFYWLTERTPIKRSIMSWLPAERANRVRRVWDDIEVKVGGWVRGQLTLMVVVGVVSAVGYFVIGVKYWPVLALFIGLAEAIPLVGPYIGTAPAVLIALTQPGNDGLPAGRSISYPRGGSSGLFGKSAPHAKRLHLLWPAARRPTRRPAAGARQRPIHVRLLQ